MTLGTLAVGTLRLRGAAADTPALRLRAARELQSADLSPASLAPSAVLVVRRLIDPLPGRFGAGGLRPPLEWERAVRHALDAAARTAARPDERGRIPSSAGAVLFADEAEIVACLLADRARGDLAARWWWRSILPRLQLPAVAADGPGLVGVLLRARPRDLPAALAHVVRWGEGARLAATIAAADAVAALDALAGAHALPRALVSPAVTDDAALAPANRAASPWSDAVREVSAGGAILAASDRASGAPWSEWLPPEIVVACSAPETYCLMGVALGLATAPARLRSPDVLSRARRWWRAAVRGPIDRASHMGGLAESPETAVDVPAAAGVAESASMPPTQLPAPSTSSSTTPEERAASRPATSSTSSTAARQASAAPPVPASPTSVPADAASATARASVEQPAAVADTAAIVESSPHAPPDAPPEPDNDTAVAPGEPTSASDGIVSDLGGVFYVIHALESLGIPDETARRFGVGDAWTALDLIARALVGPRFVSVAGDPIWDVLAQLAGQSRSRERPFAGRTASALGRRSDPRFAAPAARLNAMRDAGRRFRWATAGGRTWIWSPRGYLVAHRRAGASTTARDVRADLAAIAGVAPLRVIRGEAPAVPWMPPARLPAHCSARAGRWAATIAPAVRRRLLLALGGDDRSIRSMLDIRARVFVTSSHVDLVLRLDTADLSARRAGLDRDPGWLRAYGRVVYFHFE